MADMKDYVLLAVMEDEEVSRVCGRTSSAAVATAWSIGQGHYVYSVPLDGKLMAEGYESLDMIMEVE